MPHSRNQGVVYVLLRSSSCHLFSTVQHSVCCYLPVSLQQELISASVTGSTADSWHTSNGTCTQRHLSWQKNCQHIQQNSALGSTFSERPHYTEINPVTLTTRTYSLNIFISSWKEVRHRLQNALLIQKSNTENKYNPSYGRNLNIS